MRPLDVDSSDGGELRTRSLFSRLRYHCWFLALLWSGCIAGSLLWNLHEQNGTILKIADNSAQVTFENDLLYRKWVARQGGVYVPVSEHTPPNPYLHVPNRDITASNGLSLTLVNPAYMARQANQMAVDIRGSRGHLTSLKPIRPENGPDPWETAALESFESGVQEVGSVERTPDGEYYRLIRPFVAEKACLKCHASQGCKEGDIRGGISVSVPMAPLQAIERPHVAAMWLAHLSLWLVGLAGIVVFKNGLEGQLLARERADEALRQTAEDLARSNKDLEQFAYVASHDLKEPLRMVTGFMSLLSDHCKGRLDPKADEYVSLASDAAARMQGLIDGLLAYARAGQGHATNRTDVAATVDGVLKDLAMDLQASGATVTQAPLPTIMCNALELAQVFQNLIGNALKFRGERKPEIHIGGRRQDGHWLFTVRDNGIGIDPQFADRIFKIFERLHTREQYPGTGIGLAICKKIVERHGGRIWMESQPGKGSAFCFTIPDRGKGNG